MDCKRWPARRVAVLILTLALAIAAAAFLTTGTLGWKETTILVTGVILGAIYVWNGAKLPDWVIRYSGGRVTADDNPANISPRVYLPIILILLAAVVVAVLCVVKR